MKIRISYYDLDCRGCLKFSALLRAVHIAADENATELGIGYKQLAPLGLSFVLQRFSAAAVRLPAYAEEVTIRTWPAAIERGLFIRKGAMHAADGVKLLEWASLWLLFDLNARKILKPASLPIDTSTLLMGDKGTEISPAKVVIPADFASWGVLQSTHTHTVRYVDVDTNMHMNNAVYGDVVSNAAFTSGGTAQWSRLDVNYLAETKPGEEITVTARRMDGTDACGEILIIGEAANNAAPRRAFTARVNQGATGIKGGV